MGKRVLNLPRGGTEQRTVMAELSAEAAGVGMFDWDLFTGQLVWDDRLLEQFGYQRGTFDETIEAFNARLHPEDAPGVAAKVQESIATCGSYQAEYRIVLPGGTVRWISAKGRTLAGEDGLAERMLGATLDVTETAEAAAAAALEVASVAGRRAALVALVSAELAEHLDAEAAVARLTQLVVPGLADWSLVTLVDDQGTLRDLGCWHRDPDQLDLLRRYAQVRISSLTDRTHLQRALSGEPIVMDTGVLAGAASAYPPGEALETFRALAPESAAVYPLRARGRTLGLLSLFRGAGREPAGPEDRAATADLAGRAGLALDNSRLYRRQRHVAESLQRSLLSEPPRSEDVRIAVRYAPAAESTQVGGDWYDAFRQPGGEMTLVIGDVVGHDIRAAATMGQVRTLVRGIGAMDRDAPAVILRKVDQVLQTLEVDTTATALVARLEPVAQADVTRFRWSNAGHLPPMVLTPGRPPRLLLHDGPSDLMLGVMPSTDRRDSVAHLTPGATVLLFTDGLVERRGEPLDDGLDRLTHALEDLRGHDLESLCDGLIARLLPEKPEDDVALVAFRLSQRPDEPRPRYEAG